MRRLRRRERGEPCEFSVGREPRDRRAERAVGHAVYWLILAAVLVSAGNAVSRYLFDLSSNAWLELQWYLFSAVFLLAAGYTLLHNEHVRIDVIFGHLSPRAAPGST